MAYKKYKKEEAVRVDKIKLEAVEAVEKKEEATKTTEKATAAIKEVDGVRPANPDQNVYVASGVDTYSQQGLTDLGIYLPIETTSQEEIQRIIETIEVAPATPVVSFDLNYDVELIPVPDMDKIYSLTTVENNIWDKPDFEYADDDSQQPYALKNFINQNGKDFSISVSGIEGTEFRLAIFNETDNKYYSWEEVDSVNIDATTSEQSIISSIGFYHGERYFSGVIPASGRQIVPVSIPASSGEVCYKIGFVEVDSRDLMGKGTTDYGSILPVFGIPNPPLYKLTQLPQSSTTITLSQSVLSSNITGALTISHPPGSLLNNSISTLGKYDISLSFNPRDKVSLSASASNGILNNIHILADDFLDSQTEVLSMDLIASVSDSNLCKIVGTITLGKSSLRPSTINFDTAMIFTTNADLT